MEQAAQTELTQPIKRYVRTFAIWYIGLAVLIAIISAYFDLGSSARILVAFVAAAFVANQFLKREGRAPSDDERNALTNGSFLVWLVFNVGVSIVIFAATDILGELPDTTGFLILTLVLSLLVLAGITYFFLHLSYGWLVRKQADKNLSKR